MTLGAIQAQIVSEPQVQVELVSHPPVVLNESAILETLGGWPDGHFVLPPSSADTSQKTGNEVSTAARCSQQVVVASKFNSAARPTVREKLPVCKPPST